MKKKLVSFIVGGSLLVGFTLGAGAAPVLEKVSAHLNWGVNFVIDGEKWTPEHVNGDKIAPITYENTNYLPVRAISEALGVAVNWDQASQTITLGEGSDEVAITSEGIDFNYNNTYVFATKDKQYTVQNGKDYQSGVVIENINSAEKDFDLESNNKYQTVELSFFAMDPEDDVRIKISDGDQVLKDVTLTAKKADSTVQLEIGGVNNLNISAASAPGAKENVFVTGTYR